MTQEEMKNWKFFFYEMGLEQTDEEMERAKLNISLLEAVSVGDIGKVKELLAIGADPDYSIDELIHHIPALINAAFVAANLPGDNEEMFNLVRTETNVRVENGVWQRLLHIAAKAGNFKIFKSLVEEGIGDPAGYDGYSHSPLYYAWVKTRMVKGGNHGLIQDYLLEKLLRKPSSVKRVYQTVTKKGPVVNFEWIIGQGQVRRLILDSTGLIRRATKDEDSSSFISSGPRRVRFPDYPFEELVDSIWHPSYRNVVSSLEAGADPNVRLDRFEYNYLIHMASNRDMHNSPETIKCLIKAGADVNQKDDYGNTPLMYAGISGNAAVVQALLDNGGDPYIKNDNGISAMEATIEMADYSSGIINVMTARAIQGQKWDNPFDHIMDPRIVTKHDLGDILT